MSERTQKILEAIVNAPVLEIYALNARGEREQEMTSEWNDGSPDPEHHDEPFLELGNDEMLDGNDFDDAVVEGNIIRLKSGRYEFELSTKHRMVIKL